MDHQQVLATKLQLILELLQVSVTCMKYVAPQACATSVHQGEVLSLIRIVYPTGSYPETEKLSPISIPLCFLQCSTPSYLLDLIPPTIQPTTIYPLRNDIDILVPSCRLSLARDSFVPATVREWDTLIFQCVLLTHYLNLKRQFTVQSQC